MTTTNQPHNLVAYQATQPSEAVLPPTSPGFSYVFPPSQQPYIERVVEGFTTCLSPQQLRYNSSLRNLMDEQLWIPITSITKLPELDSLHMTSLMLPYVTAVLWRYCSDSFEIDARRGLLRPRWALQSSAFIANVGEAATAETMYSLLEGVSPPEGGWGDVRILKHGKGMWSLLFGRPSCGAYAAIGIQGKWVHGGVVRCTACVCVNPPQAVYNSEGITVVEIDPLVYGVPIMPRETARFYTRPMN